MGRLCQPEEVARTCLYLATDATYSTGQNVHVSGGCELDYGFKANMDFLLFKERANSQRKGLSGSLSLNVH